MNNKTSINWPTMFESAHDYIGKNKEILNNMNVYPVPDGDTGSNMYATLAAVVEKLNQKKQKKYIPIIIEEMLNHSRGNSGFILSCFFEGLFESLKDAISYITTKQFALAFENGSYKVRTSLLTPVEGTMITVIADMAKCLSKNTNKDIKESLELAVVAGEKSLFETPIHLPVLATAGVVDSGALGFLFIIKSFLNILQKKENPIEKESNYRFEPKESVESNIKQIQYKFCVEAVVKKIKEDNFIEFKRFLKSIGNSIAFLNDENILKIHIHTNQPDSVFDKISTYGALTYKKVDEMEKQILYIDEQLENKKCTVLALIQGSGFIEVFEQLGCQYTLLYNKQLPSSKKILKKIEKIPCDNILVLSNNKNNIPSIQMVAKQIKKNIVILPTNSVVEGLTCMYGFIEDEKLIDNYNMMIETKDIALEIQIYRASKDSKVGNKIILKDNLFAVSKGEIISVNKNENILFLEILDNTIVHEFSSVTVYMGKACSNVLKSLLEDVLKTNNIFSDYQFISGNQENSIMTIMFE